MNAERQGSPNGHTTPPDGYQSWDEYMLEEEHRAHIEQAWRHDHQARRGLKAMRLAPDLTTYRALLDDQPVPVAALDPNWAARYGLTTAPRRAA